MCTQRAHTGSKLSMTPKMALYFFQIFGHCDTISDRFPPRKIRWKVFSDIKCKLQVEEGDTLTVCLYAFPRNNTLAFVLSLMSIQGSCRPLMPERAFWEKTLISRKCIAKQYRPTWSVISASHRLQPTFKRLLTTKKQRLKSVAIVVFLKLFLRSF